MDTYRTNLREEWWKTVLPRPLDITHVDVT